MTSRLNKAVVAALALLLTPFTAQAADQPVRPVYKAAPRSVIAYYNWTGFYIGGVVGYGTGKSTWDFGGLVPSTEVSPKGMMYGITLGYNWQLGSIVYGIEGDYSFASVKGDASCIAATVTCETTNNSLATLRGRVGYAFDRFLPYLTAGGAYGNVKAHIFNAATSFETSKGRLGYTIGAGLEYAFLSNWSAKIEYLYVNLGTFDTGFFPGVNNSVSFNENVIRVGLNYKFGGPIFSRW